MQRRVKLWLLAMAAIAAASGLAAYRLRESQLLAKATLIAHTDGWALPNGTDAQNYMTCFWPSSREVLFFESDDQFGPELLCRHDVTTRVQTPFRTVSRRWCDDGGFKKEIKISPDGQWILWGGDYDADGPDDYSYHGYYGARRDGTARFHVAGKGWPQIYFFQWLSDSRHFLETTARYIEKTHEYKILRVAMRSVDAPGNTSEPPYNVAAIPGTPTYSPAPGVRVLTYCGYPGTPAYAPTPGGRLIVVSIPEKDWPPRRYTLQEYVLTRTPKRLRHWTIDVPKGEDRQEIAISLRNDRIAWFIKSEGINPFAAFLHRTYSRFKAAPWRRVRLCVSRLDGTGMREIGGIDLPVHSDDQYDSGDWDGPPYTSHPGELKWLPDGRHLSFLYSDKLYRVDAE